MPQFDKILFFNQFFWLVFTFFSFYILIAYRFLPKLGCTLKIRNKKLKKNKDFLIPLRKEESSIFNNLSSLSVGAFGTFYCKEK